MNIEYKQRKFNLKIVSENSGDKCMACHMSNYVTFSGSTGLIFSICKVRLTAAQLVSSWICDKYMSFYI